MIIIWSNDNEEMNNNVYENNSINENNEMNNNEANEMIIMILIM